MRIWISIALAACGSKQDAPQGERGSAGSAGSAFTTKPDASPAGPAVPLGPDGLPIVCGDWKAAVDKLATCTAFPDRARESLITVYKETSAGWGQLPADAKKNLTTICKAGADAVLQGAKATCGW